MTSIIIQIDGKDVRTENVQWEPPQKIVVELDSRVLYKAVMKHWEKEVRLKRHDVSLHDNDLVF